MPKSKFHSVLHCWQLCWYFCLHTSNERFCQITRSMSIVSKSMPSLMSSKRSSDDIITSSTIGSSSSSISTEPRRLCDTQNEVVLLFPLFKAFHVIWRGLQSYIACCMWFLILAYCTLTRSCCWRASACCLCVNIHVTWVLQVTSE